MTCGTCALCAWCPVDPAQKRYSCWTCGYQADSEHPVGWAHGDHSSSDVDTGESLQSMYCPVCMLRGRGEGAQFIVRVGEQEYKGLGFLDDDKDFDFGAFFYERAKELK